MSMYNKRSNLSPLRISAKPKILASPISTMTEIHSPSLLFRVQVHPPFTTWFLRNLGFLGHEHITCNPKEIATHACWKEASEDLARISTSSSSANYGRNNRQKLSIKPNHVRIQLWRIGIPGSLIKYDVMEFRCHRRSCLYQHGLDKLSEGRQKWWVASIRKWPLDITS